MCQAPLHKYFPLTPGRSCGPAADAAPAPRPLGRTHRRWILRHHAQAHLQRGQHPLQREYRRHVVEQRRVPRLHGIKGPGLDAGSELMNSEHEQQRVQRRQARLQQCILHGIQQHVGHHMRQSSVIPSALQL